KVQLSGLITEESLKLFLRHAAPLAPSDFVLNPLEVGLDLGVAKEPFEDLPVRQLDFVGLLCLIRHFAESTSLLPVLGSTLGRGYDTRCDRVSSQTNYDWRRWTCSTRCGLCLRCGSTRPIRCPTRCW